MLFFDLVFQLLIQAEWERQIVNGFVLILSVVMLICIYTLNTVCLK